MQRPSRPLDTFDILAALIALATCVCNGNAVAQTENPSGINGVNVLETGSTQIWITEPGDTGLNRWDPRQLFEESGEVLDWNAKKIVVRRPGPKAGITIPEIMSFESNPRGQMRRLKRSTARFCNDNLMWSSKMDWPW